MSDLKQYFKHFSVLFIITAVFCVIYAVAYFAFPKTENEVVLSGNHSRVYGDQRVFDYGNQLTDEEEYKLEQYIHEAEIKATSDIVIVTLNQSLKDYEPEYMSKYTMTITPDKYVMVFADKFWEDNKFGYDCPQVLDGTQNTGDGVILVDNVYREDETGKIYTWMGTTGKCETKYSSSMIDEALDRFYDYVEYDYYKACIAFVDSVVGTMAPGHFDASELGFMPTLVPLVILLIYYLVNRKSKAAKVTTSAKTYIINGSSVFTRQEDNFVRKTVTKRYNPPQSSSGGGGGGHHSSGGGGSHGGGGHSR